MRLESSIQSEIIEKANKLKRCVAYKHCPYPTGWPDVAILYRGHTLYFEVKRSKGDKARKLQKYRIKRIRKTGNKAYVVRSWGEVWIILKDLRWNKN